MELHIAKTLCLCKEKHQYLVNIPQSYDKRCRNKLEIHSEVSTWTQGKLNFLCILILISSFLHKLQHDTTAKSWGLAFIIHLVFLILIPAHWDENEHLELDSVLSQKQAGAAGDAPCAAASPSGTPTSDSWAQKHNPCSIPPRKTQENLKVHPALQAGITAPGQLRNPTALLRIC